MEKMDNIIISICVPVYNREQYLNDCLESIKKQNIDTRLFEILFYDDASTDSSLTIINNFISENPDLSIHLFASDKNKGLWNARNTLYDNARGKYILCVDADDMLAPEILPVLLEITNADNPDMIIFPYSVIDGNGKYIKTVDSSLSSINSLSINRFPIDTYHFAIWNKLIKSELIQNLKIKVPHGINCWEDLSVTARIFTMAKKIILIHRPGYFYRKHGLEAYTSHNHKRILEQHIECTDFLVEWFNSEKLDEKYSEFINHLKFATKIKMLRGDSFEYRRWKHSYPETNRYIMTMPGVPLHYRLLFKLLSLF